MKDKIKFLLNMLLKLVSNEAREKAEGIQKFIEQNIKENERSFDDEQAIWQAARQYEEIPVVDNIYYEMLVNDLKLALCEFSKTPKFAKILADEYVTDAKEEDIRNGDVGLTKLYHLLEKGREYEDKIIEKIQEYITNNYQVVDDENDNEKIIDILSEIDFDYYINDLDTHFYVNGEDVTNSPMETIEMTMLHAVQYNHQLNYEEIVDYVAKELFNVQLNVELVEKDEVMFIIKETKIHPKQENAHKFGM